MTNYHPDLIQKAVLAYYLNNVAKRIKQRNIPFANLYGLSSRHQSFFNRMAAIREGKKEKVNFNGMAKRMMKSAFGDYSSVIPLESLHFVKNLSDKVQLIIEFEKIHLHGLGKTFKINLLMNVSVDGKRKIEIGNSLFYFLGSLETFCWTYVTVDDLEKIMAEVIDLLKKVLPYLESLPTSDIVRVYEECPEFVPVRGPMTARQGIEEAKTLAKSWANDAVLMMVQPYVVDLVLFDELGSKIGFDGISRSHGGWRYMYLSIEKDEDLWVYIPFLGIHSLEAFHLRSRIIYQFNRSFEIDWIDSDRAGLVVIKHIQKEVGSLDTTTIDPSLFELIFDPSRYNLDPPIWRMAYSIYFDKLNKKNRKDWRLAIDALDGRIVEEKFWLYDKDGQRIDSTDEGPFP